MAVSVCFITLTQDEDDFVILTQKNENFQESLYVYLDTKQGIRKIETNSCTVV